MLVQQVQALSHLGLMTSLVPQDDVVAEVRNNSSAFSSSSCDSMRLVWHDVNIVVMIVMMRVPQGDEARVQDLHRSGMVRLQGQPLKIG